MVLVFDHLRLDSKLFLINSDSKQKIAMAIFAARRTNVIINVYVNSNGPLNLISAFAVSSHVQVNRKVLLI